MFKDKKNVIIAIVGTIAFVAIIAVVFMAGRMSNTTERTDISVGNQEKQEVVEPKETTNEIKDSTNTVAKKNETTSNKTETKNNVQGKYYNMVSLVDTYANVVVFKGLLPSGWTAMVSSNYQVISPDYPVLESVSITSPDGKANIYIDSQQQYCESSSMGEGASLEYYTTYLHYMTADEFVQYFMDYAYPGATLTKTLQNDTDILDQARQFQKIKAQNSRNNMATITGNAYTYNITEGQVTMSKKQYKTSTNSYIEGSCVIVPFTSTLGSQYYTLTNTYWEIPYSIVYEAADKASFDKYYDDYNFIIANSQFTQDCYALVEYVSSCIANVKSAEAAAKSKASLDAMNSYIESNYSSTSSASTNEKVMQMWDDYINEVDSYNTLDGGTIKTSMYNDIVAQNGDQFFIGSSTSDIPYGFKELSKSY